MPALAAARRQPGLTFACDAGNDLYVAAASGFRCSRYGTPAEAIEKAPSASSVLLLADGYPASRLAVGPELVSRAEEKRLRLWIEYPESLPGQPAGPARETAWERVVVSSESFGAALPQNRIVMPLGLLGERGRRRMGPWNAESCWSADWASEVLALRMKKTSVWDITAGSGIASRFTAGSAEMARNAGGLAAASNPAFLPDHNPPYRGCLLSNTLL